VSAWTAAVSGARRDGALLAARHVAGAIADRARVQEAVLAAPEQTAFERSVRWHEHDVAQGDAGLALACAQLDRCFPGDGWDVVAHEYLSCGVRSIEGERLAPGLFSGVAGLAFTTALLSRGGTRYRRLAATLEAELTTQTEVLARTVGGRREGLAAREFDVISGLAGIAAHLLARPAVDGATQAALRALADLAGEPGPAPGIARWFTPPELFAHEEEVRLYPHGSLNCGLAHGIAGPIAALALALARGATVDGLGSAVRTGASWLADHRTDDRWGVNWPTMVSLPEGGAADAPSRAAWCYGAPGVARALWLAGAALGDDDLSALAIRAMECVYERPLAARQIDSPTFCHGVAGLLAITLRFRNDTGLAVFDDAAGALVDQLLDAFEPGASLLGFRAIEPGGSPVDQPGLLDGAPGVALVLLAAATPVPPSWDRLFLLA